MKKETKELKATKILEKNCRIKKKISEYKILKISVETYSKNLVHKVKVITKTITQLYG